MFVAELKILLETHHSLPLATLVSSPGCLTGEPCSSFTCPSATCSTAQLDCLPLWPSSPTDSFSEAIENRFFVIEHSVSGSGTLCSFTAGLRNLIAYADIFTMVGMNRTHQQLNLENNIMTILLIQAAIALATCFGFVCHNDCTLARVTNTPKVIKMPFLSFQN